MTIFSHYSDCHNYASAMKMAGALSVTPVRPYVRNYIRLSRRRPLSKSNIFNEFYETWSHCLVP